jgi:hypothetical protein
MVTMIQEVASLGALLSFVAGVVLWADGLAHLVAVF